MIDYHISGLVARRFIRTRTSKLTRNIHYEMSRNGYKNKTKGGPIRIDIIHNKGSTHRG